MVTSPPLQILQEAPAQSGDLNRRGEDLDAAGRGGKRTKGRERWTVYTHLGTTMRRGSAKEKTSGSGCDAPAYTGVATQEAVVPRLAHHGA